MYNDLFVPPKPVGYCPPPEVVPRNHPSGYDVEHPEYPLYPATGPPPPAQVIHTQNPAAYQQSHPPHQGQHSVVIVDGYSQQQQKQFDKKQCCMMTVCALCLCCLLD